MQQTDLFKRVRVSTRDLPNTISEKQRISMWRRDWVAKWRELYGHGTDCEVAAVDDTPFCAELIGTMLPGLWVNTFHRSPARVTIAPEGAHPVFACIGVFRTGRAEWIDRGKTIAGKVGTAGVVTSESLGKVERYSEGTFTSLILSQTAISNVVASVGSLSPTSIPAHNPALRLLIQYLDIVQSGEGFDRPEIAKSASMHILDLAVLALGARGDAAAVAMLRGAKAARYATITSDVRAMIGNPNLSADDIADRHHISPRYLRKLFEEAGTSFSAFVLAERLEKIRRMLADRRYTHLSIADIAYESGFGDLSYFNRVFKRNFGATPSDFREMSRAV